ncbi:TetR/AcrR family transcriptional regulator [Methylovirgula sp. 4M-Z18]|uniref:TetR/AcrR family transcriptional regulator n=1 Tax=Methylovirgula sp. 4M-Z18 TaxID=2293567 RepID=UPI000E2E4853|nr:TetR/AcrR family transcriptional regulator [Methylovirgula sp. 4M-Z18]RFB74979.1 TetR/AcrR family transcriptional regulator [Methylovirgula sp. 4M-Z18]
MASVIHIKDRRTRLRETLVQLVQDLMASEGLGAVQARRLAQLAGCSVGAIYNVFPDLNDLILTANVDTLDRLLAQQRTALERLPPHATRTAQLVALALATVNFAHDFEPAWRALYDHRGGAQKPYPDWYAALHVRPVTMIERIILAEEPNAAAGHETSRLARGLWSALLGIVVDGMDTRKDRQKRDEIEAQASLLVTIAAQGLEAILEMRRKG